MNVNFEFLGEEPLDNVITCLDYRFDKVVFFGYEEQMQRQKKTLPTFLNSIADFPDICKENLGTEVKLPGKKRIFG